MSSGNDFRGSWNEGESTQLGETFQYIEDPIKHVLDTNGLLKQEPEGTPRSKKEVEKLNAKLSKQRSKEVNAASPKGEQQWNQP